MIENLQRRVQALERKSGGDVIFTAGDGSQAGIRTAELLDSLNEALTGKRTRRAGILLNARKASDGSRLHELAQALAAGPVPPGEVNE